MPDTVFGFDSAIHARQSELPDILVVEKSPRPGLLYANGRAWGWILGVADKIFDRPYLSFGSSLGVQYLAGIVTILPVLEIPLNQ